MENSLRNHALVQQQNQQQQRNREEYYRTNGMMRSSSASAAPASSSLHGNNSNNMNSNRSRASGSSASGKGGSKSSTTGSSRSTRSGEASDEAVGPAGSSAQHHRYSQEQQNQQQQQHQYHMFQQQQYQQQYHQQQRYPQHHQYYSNSGSIRIPQQQQQDQYGYPIHHDSMSGSQQSSTYHHQYIGQQQQHHGGHYGGSAAEGTAGSQSHYSNILGSVGGSVASNPTADEAYRRLGQRLSWSAHGGDSDASRSSACRFRKAPQRIGFKLPSSCFVPFQEALKGTRRERDKEETPSNGGVISSNGNKEFNKGNLTRKMTLQANQLFRRWHTEHSQIHFQQQHRRRKNGVGSRPSSRTSKMERSGSKEDISPHQRSFAQMSLVDSSHVHGHSNMLSSSSKKHHQPGSLSAVIESSSQNSSTTNSRNPKGSNGSRSQGGGCGYSKGDGSGSVRSEDKSRASSSIATRSSMGTRNSIRSFGTLPPRGKCLTQPSEGVSNDNLCDNVEGNLIVYENDNISVPKKQVHVLTKGKIPKGAPSSDFRIQSLLGQGTFAQVFRCLHTQTGQLVAVKIVKNKPAYTRQAAVEIDVIRALTTNQNDTSNGSKKSKNNSDNKDRNKNISNNESQTNKSGTSDYMVDMVCYFMYKDHLCLVFELLGLNLYEVLKKRQFRGLPLAFTQTLVRQAILGARGLAQRSIVHCDLKPENILLVDDDDSESVMSAGESKRLLAASSSLLNANATKQHTYKKKNPSLTADANPTNESTAGNYKNNGQDDYEEGQTQVSDQSNSTEDTANTRHKQKKTQTDQIHSSENSKSTTETDNTKRNASCKEHPQQLQATTTAESTEAFSNSSSRDKSNVRTANKSPMDSTIATNETQTNPICNQKIKLIDFGSACFEGQMSHTYIQSRFYRSPEVLLGLAYDSAIDMWSLGCVAAELFLGLPILPGVHEHDQLGRIIEMIGDTPDWMLDQGTKSSKYYIKYVPNSTPAPTPPIPSSSTTPDGRPSSTEAATSGRSGSEAPRPLPQWRIKTQHEYIASLSQNEIEKKGGRAKLQKQPGNRYFKRKLLSDIILHKGQSGKQEDMRLLKSFIHFLYGILDPDPWKRWTAFQVASHPFLTGATMESHVEPPEIKDENHANRLFNVYWAAPSDPTIYRRKLLNVQKTREKQQAARRGFNRGHGHSRSRSESPSSQDGLPAVRNGFSRKNNQIDDTQFVASHTDEAFNQAAAPQIRQGSYQGSFNMSSSMTQFGSNQGIRLMGYNSAISGAQPIFSGPQSFSEAGNSVVLPGSYNEVDFALALQRPGVVPMGDSVTTATTSTTSMSSSNNSRSTYNQSNNLISQVGSYGSHQVLQYGHQQRRFASGSIPRTSRSFGEGDLAPTASTAIPTVIDSRHHHVLYASSQDSTMDIGPPMEFKTQIEMNVGQSMEPKGESVPNRPASATSIKTGGQASPETVQPSRDETSAPASNTNTVTSHTQPNQNLGVYDNPQAYQQQFAAMQQQFQQQQLLLQQQQAALALQQQQLRAYYSNMSSAAGMNAQQFGIPGAAAAPVAAINAQQFGIHGAPATPAATISAQQFGIQGPPATQAATINTQQFGIPGAPVPTINAQQFGLPSNTQASVQAAPLNPQQFGLAGAAAAVQGAGYYVVPAADGTQIIMASNQGLAIPISGQVPGMPPMQGILPGQIPTLPAGPTQIQGIAPAGLPSVGVPQGPPVSGIQGIPGMHAGGLMTPAGTVSGIGPTEISSAPTMNNQASPAPSVLYPNTNKQQHLHHQA